MKEEEKITKYLLHSGKSHVYFLISDDDDFKKKILFRWKIMPT
jgi:hypothetical protein